MLKDKVLYLLEQQKGQVVKGGKIAQELGVSRTAVWKAIHALQEDGNEIIALPNSGYQLSDTNDTLMENLISEKLTTAFIGRKIKLLPTVPSTNQYLKEMDADSVEDGFTVIADEQTSGRGRKGRCFVSPKQAGIYMSVLLKVGALQVDIRFLTICAAAAVSKAIETICGISTGIKWVNDIYCNGKKICGILTEATISGELQQIDTVIIGIGVNTGNVPEEVRSIATSVEEEAGRRGMRNLLAAEVLNRLEQLYLDYTVRGSKQEIIAYYDSRLFVKEKQILVKDHGKEYQAIATGIDDMGALIVKDRDGNCHHLNTGEIIIDSEEDAC